MKVDPYGECPQCHYNWDGGDVLEHMQKLEIYFGRTDEYIKSRAQTYYGYTEEHKRRFSRLTIHKLPVGSQVCYVCPNCMVALQESDKTNSILIFKSVYDARNKAATPLRVISEELE